MRQFIIFFFIGIMQFPLSGQEEVSKAVANYLKEYQAVLNNLSDPEYSLNERKLFREDILDIYFTRGETKVYNHLNDEGTRILRGREYLENLMLDFETRVRHELIVDEDMEFNIQNSTFTVPVTHVLHTNSGKKSNHLLYIIKWYNDRRPDIISILNGEEAWSTRKEVQAYNKAKEINTITAYQTYLNEYPDGEFSEEATEGISILKEEQAWATARESNSVSSYQTYIDAYPNGKYVDVANENIRELKAIARYESLPPSIKDLVDNMATVEGGSFTMGCTTEQQNCFEDEKDLKTVEVDGFQMGIHEVTQEQWVAIMGNNPSHFSACPECPVEQVSWNDVQQFLQKLNEMTGDSYRLPTEKEWEYAARGGNKSNNYKYAGGNDIMQVALYAGNNLFQLTSNPKQANELGLHDMSGSVYEWCQDDYTEMPSADTELKVIRGGAWNSAPRYCRVSHRFWLAPDGKMDNIGFRIVRNLRYE